MIEGVLARLAAEAPATLRIGGKGADRRGEGRRLSRRDYHTARDQYLVSCDFPYVGGWHELSVGYEGIGWSLEGRTVEQVEVDEQMACDVAFLDLTKPDGRSAMVAFTGRYADGSPVDAPALTLQEAFMVALSRRKAPDARNSCQLQVIAEDASGVSERRREQSLRLLLAAQAACQRVADRVLREEESGAPTPAQ